jgi:plasmid stabilization system protein ParE
VVNSRRSHARRLRKRRKSHEVEFAEDLEEDLDRIKEQLISHGANVEARIAEIFKALTILQRNPYIGYEVEGGMRELVMGDKSKHRGYFVLYDVLPTMRRMSPRG